MRLTRFFIVALPVLFAAVHVMAASSKISQEKQTILAYKAILQDPSLRAFLNTDQPADKQSFEMYPVNTNEFRVNLLPRCAQVIFSFSTQNPQISFGPIQCDYYPPATSERYTDFKIYDQRASNMLRALNSWKFEKFIFARGSDSLFLRQEGTDSRDGFIVSPGNFIDGQFEGNGTLYSVGFAGSKIKIFPTNGPGGGASVGN